MAARIIRRSISVALVSLIALSALPPTAFGQQVTASKVRVTLTRRWSKPSPDPSGLAYHRNARRLLVVDSEVEETRRWKRANIWMVRMGGTPRRAWSIARFTVEPTDVAYRDRRTFFISDDNADRIFHVRRGPDRRWGTRDDVVSSFRTEPFGSGDPEGLEIVRGHLFITDGNDARIYRVRPGPNGTFDGVAPAGDDVVTSFPTFGLGARDPEDVAFDSATGLLYIISRLDDRIVRTTLGGVLVDQIDLSGAGLVSPAGITLAPGSAKPGERHVYISDRGIDNDPGAGDPNENDGRLFEFSLSG